MDITKLLRSAPVYLYDSFEDMMVRLDPVDGWFVKRRGHEERKDGPESNLVMDFLRGADESAITTREAYEAFT